MIKINNKCNNCGICIDICPRIVFRKGTDAPTVKETKCIRCGHCISVCPKDAINHEGVTGHIIPKGPQLKPEQVHSFLRSRRSIRNFSDKDVSKKDIEKLIDIARYAPSSHNKQNYEFIILKKSRKLLDFTNDFYKILILFLENPIKRFFTRVIQGKVINEAYKSLDEFKCLVQLYDRGEDKYTYDAPSIVIIHSKRIFGATSSCAYAGYNMTLMAHSLGLGMCQMFYLQAVANYGKYFGKSLNKFLGIPTANKIYCVYTLGYPKYKYRKLVSRNTAKCGQN